MVKSTFLDYITFPDQVYRDIVIFSKILKLTILKVDVFEAINSLIHASLKITHTLFLKLFIVNVIQHFKNHKMKICKVTCQDYYGFSEINQMTSYAKVLLR